MNHCSRVIITIGLVVVFLTGVCPVADIAQSAPAPGVSLLPEITREITTPVRLAKDSGGFLYVTNPAAGGILQYNSSGVLVRKIATSKSGAGVAIAQNGDILVTQGTYVSVFNKTTFVETQFGAGTFVYANGIAVDTAGNIYVTDGKANKIFKFTSGYAPDPTTPVSAITLSRPAGITFEKTYNSGAGALFVANSLSGTVLMVDPANLTLIKTIGSTAAPFGYDATNALIKFTYPQGVAIEYNETTGLLDRIYIADGYQSTIKVLDGQYVLNTAGNITIGTGGAYLADIGGYGFVKGKIFNPSDVLFDPTVGNKRIFVANGGGNLTVFGIDNMQPTYIQVINPQLDSLTVTWTNPATPGFASIRIYRSDAAGNVINPTPLVPTPVNGTSYVDSGITVPGTYYYLVRAVDNLGTEYANTLPVSGRTLIAYLLTLNTTAGGSITNCVNSVCANGQPSVNVFENNIVTLKAIPNTTSVFDGWTGACEAFGVSEDCQVTMDAAKSTTATFSAQWPFLVDDEWYTLSLQDAHDTALGSGSKIKAMVGTWPASSIIPNLMVADRAITTTVQGGYDSSFADPAVSGTTIVQGRVNLKAGKTVFKNIRIRP